jgi:hypothetical protein
MKWRTKWVMLVKVNAILFLASVKNDNLHPIFRLQHGFTVLFKQLQAKDEAIFKQLLKTVHPEF